MTEALTQTPFVEVAALLTLAVAVATAGLLLRQPLIVSFIAAGIIAGPSVLDIARSHAHIELLADIGIAVLLFLVGIRLDLKLVSSLGAVALYTGLGQVAFTSILGFAVGIALGYDATTSIYVAVALTFSSTIIIVKLLSDKREIDSLHGQIALGFLIVQDLVVVLAMVLLSALGIGAGGDASVADILEKLGGALVALVAVLLFVRYLADALTQRLARSSELLVSFAIALAVLFAAIGDGLGFGKEIGGLLAGVALASTPCRDAIAARLAPLRDFLLLFFFIALGARLDPATFGDQYVAALVFSLFVLLGNPLIVMVIMGTMGYRKRTGFLAGLTVAQISEFSLIFMTMGVAIGHVGEDALGLVTMVGLITIALSTYMITYSHPLYGLLEPFLSRFERSDPKREPKDAEAAATAQDVVLLGLGRYGGAIAARLLRRGLRVLAVDFNPGAISEWRGRGLTTIYGDATDPEFLATLPLSSRWVICAIRHTSAGLAGDDPNLTVVATLRARGYTGRIAVSAGVEIDAARLRAVGADVVLDPFIDAADRADEVIEVDK